MQFKTKEERTNPVLQRKELTVTMDFEGGPTPKAQELAAKVAEAHSTAAELVEIIRMDTSPGRSSGTARINVWANAETREKFKAHKRKKQTKKEGEAAPTQPKK
jgi:ribosomal protein S24E